MVFEKDLLDISFQSIYRPTSHTLKLTNLKMKKAKKVTRIAYSDDLNQAKYEALTEIAGRCGSVRTEV
ncbi:MAG: hypothetical protein DRR16_28590, partial [Candidatus Parabeggiatoa sp. nov. 3]